MRAQATSSGAMFWYAILLAMIVAMLVFTLSRPAAETPADPVQAATTTATLPAGN